MADQSHPPTHFNLGEIAASFPDTAETMLLNRYLVDTPTASTRVFRVYRPAPAHLHRHSDEHLVLLSGRGTFWIGDPASAQDLGPGNLLVFPRNTPHATTAVLEHPLVVLAIDTPRRNPADVHFLDPADGSPTTFIRETSQTQR